MGEIIKSIGYIILIIFMIVVFMSLLIGFAAYNHYQNSKLICERLEGYDYTVRLRKLSIIAYDCEILLEKRGWVKSYDFQMAAAEKPVYTDSIKHFNQKE